MKPRGCNRATEAERAEMEKGCTCHSAGFGVEPEKPCPRHSKPVYYSYAMGEYGQIHFLIRMPSGWLVGIPESEMAEQMELQEPNPTQDPAYHTHTLIRPDETREPDDEQEAKRGAAKAADALSRFIPFRHCPAPEVNVPDEIWEDKRILCKTCGQRFDPGLRELKCPHRYKSMDHAAMDDHRELAELKSKVKHITHWMVEWGQKHDAATGSYWDGIRELREEQAVLTKRVDEICEVLKDLAKRGGGKPVELMRFK